MWHEARKQERRIRGMIVDYRKRAERRQDFYEKIQADPTQFIQVHGRRCKIHLDPAVAAAGDGAAIIVPWQGQQDNLIDRFDVRAHLDYISPATKSSDSAEVAELTFEERQCNYERYRILAQNDFLNVTEEKFLHQLYLEEQYGANAQLELERNQNRKKQHKSGAAIGYSYEEVDSSVGPQPFSHLMHVPSQSAPLSSAGKSEKDSDSESDSDMDMDVAIDISKLDTTQAHELNACGRNYGMISNDFYSYLTKDADEADALRIAREEEQEKMLLSGRKSRRERRAQKERRIASRPFSPPSYAAKDDSTTGKKENEEESDSRSPSPADMNAGKITYITSFGGEDELQPHSKISINISSKGAQTLGESCVGATAAAAATTQVTTYAQKVKENLEKLKQLNEGSKSSRRSSACRRSYTRTRSRSIDRRRRRSRWRSRSRSKSYEYSSRRSQRRRKGTRSRSFSRRRHYRSSSSGKSSHRSRSNSSSSYYSRRKRTHSKNRVRTPSSADRRLLRSRSSSKKQPHTQTCSSAVAITNTAIISRIENKTITANIKTTDVGGVSPPVMISYPLPTTIKTTKPADSTVVAITTVPTAAVVQPPTPPLKRYYGRKRGNDSSSRSESDSEIDKDPIKAQTVDGNDSDDHMDVDTTSEISNPLPSSSTTGKHTTTAQAKNPSFSIASETKSSGSSRLNLRERLKRKMQNLLNKQYKADKRAETEKCERERQLQQEREDEMRELALKLRRRQRELRHRYGTPNSSKASDSEVSERMKSHTTKRSKSHSSDRSMAVEKLHNKPTGHGDEFEDHHRHHRERDRKQRSRSRSQSHRNRRSTSRRRRRSASRPRRGSGQSYDRGSRYGGDRISSRHDDRGRRSRSKSKNDRLTLRDRERQRERDSNRDRDRERYRAKERDRERDREKCQRGGGSAVTGRSATATSLSVDACGSGSSRNRIVISAPPKLKKLVDY